MKGINMLPGMFFRAIFQIPSCIFIKDTKCRYRFATQRWKQLNTDDIYGKTDLEIRNDVENVVLAREMDKKVLETGEGVTYTIKDTTSGETVYLEVIKQPIYRGKKVIGIVGLINNVTEKILLNQELERISSTDYLTGLLNRQIGTHRINDSLQEPGSKMFCLLDIDRFKHFNDMYGHQTGDALLKRVAEALQKSVFNKDIVMRLGGDEFVILLNNIDIDTLHVFTKKLFKEINNIKIDKINEAITISIGITQVTDRDTCDSLYAKADRNMYRAKNEEGNYYVYS